MSSCPESAYHVRHRYHHRRGSIQILRSNADRHLVAPRPARNWYVQGYSEWLVADLHLTMQRIKDLADHFPFWQHHKGTGRPPVPERDLMIAFLMRQPFDITFQTAAGAPAAVQRLLSHREGTASYGPQPEEPKYQMDHHLAAVPRTHRGVAAATPGGRRHQRHWLLRPQERMA